MKRFLILLLAVATLVACKPSAPLIGISCSRSSTGATTLNTTYTDAVARAGGLPVVFPTVTVTPESEARPASGGCGC